MDSQEIIKDDDLNKYANSSTDIKDIINSEHEENAFFVCDAKELVERCRLWKEAMPRVVPHYAVKCNDHKMVLIVLAAMEFGFDCASLNEIRKVLSIGVEPSRIIYANSIKPFDHIRYAASKNVDLVTFDNEAELYKLQKMHPNVRAIIRIRYNGRAVCCFGSKFGCNPETEAPALLLKAKYLGINVVGVSFHVGSGCYEPSVYYDAIKSAREVFDFASTLGYNLTLLDIGGGFTTKYHNTIYKYAKYINTAIEEFFPEETIKIISEPGTYFVENAFTLVCRIHSKKALEDSNCISKIMYYVNDSVYGSFLIRLLDQMVNIPQPLKKHPTSKIYPSIIWGQTMDSLDLIVSDILLPEMNIGDWVVFPNMGDYTLTSSTSFNGFEAPKIYNIIDNCNWLLLSNTKYFDASDFSTKSEAADVFLISN